MKYLSYTFLLILLSSSQLWACDTCGGGGFYMGVLPQFHKNFVGLRYRNMTFAKPYDYGGASSNNIQQADLTLRYYPLKRLQIMAILPYMLQTSRGFDHFGRVHGVGDASLMCAYKTLNIGNDTSNWKQQLWLGGGIKLPTGIYKNQPQAEKFNPEQATGTGSTDLMAMVQYSLRYKKWGLNANYAYKHNFANRYGYRFGNQQNLNLTFFRLWNVKRIGIMPSVGYYGERLRADKENDKVVYGTSGRQQGGQLGLDFFWGKLQAGLLVQQPLTHNYADRTIVPSARFAAQIGCMF